MKHGLNTDKKFKVVLSFPSRQPKPLLIPHLFYLYPCFFRVSSVANFLKSSTKGGKGPGVHSLLAIQVFILK
jgi:hypothetical protein